MDLITKLVAIAAKNAPTALNESYMDISVLDEAEKEMLVEEMYQLADERKDEIFTEKGEDIEKADSVILIGVDGHPGLGIDCKACGYENCEQMEEAKDKNDIFIGPNCVYRIIDIGVSLGYAIQNATDNDADAWVSIKGGLAAQNMGLSTSRICLAVPISLDSKEKLFDL